MIFQLAKYWVVFAMFVAFASSRRKPDFDGHGEDFGGFPQGYGARQPCEACFAPDKCVGGLNETLGKNCSDCLKDICESEFEVSAGRSGPLYNAFGIRCISEAWQNNCTSSCPTWNNDRVAACRGCVANCLNKRDRYDSCPVKFVRHWEACSSCINENSCFNSSELAKQFSDFCFGYVDLVCQDNTTDDCFLDAIKSPCSQCDASAEVITRLETCSACFNNCRTEGECINNCRRVNNYPAEVPCGYCSLFCRLEGRTRRPRHWGIYLTPETPVCQVNSTVCPACETCDSCVDQCKASSAGDFNFSNLCTCARQRYFHYDHHLKAIGLKNFFGYGRLIQYWD